jgi:peptide deformylase
MIVHHPDPILLRPTRKVENFDDSALVPTIKGMFTAMYKHKGIGLAANQIGNGLRIAVMHVPGWPEMVLLNPHIVRAKGEDTAEEGCLSVPGHRVRVTRPAKVWIEYRDQRGEPKQLAARGLLARCIQHEIDHLDGLTCLERVQSA